LRGQEGFTPNHLATLCGWAFHFVECSWPRHIQASNGKWLLLLFLLVLASVSFIGEFLPNFDLENIIAALPQGFFMEKMTQICQILKSFFLSNHQIFMISPSR
jgi:hypothetical protein